MPRSKISLGPTALAAVRAAAEAHELTVEEVMTLSRRRECVQARKRAMVLLRKQGWTLPRIAKVFRVDHTTVLYHTKNAKLDAPADPRRPTLGD